MLTLAPPDPPKKLTTQDVLEKMISAQLADSSDLLGFVTSLASPAMCEYLAKKGDFMYVPLEWWTFDALSDRLTKMRLSERLLILEQLVNVAKWVEDMSTGEAWETEAFLEVFLKALPKDEAELRALVEVEIPPEGENRDRHDVAVLLGNIINLTRRICL